MHKRLKPANLYFGLAGFVITVAGILRYTLSGFSPYLWLFWLIGLSLLLLAAFWASPPAISSPRRWPGRHDWTLLGLLLLIFVPLYLYNVHGFPRQMNTDEIAIMASEKHLATSPNIDVFEPSYYSDLPTLAFWALGKIGLALGGVTLTNTRIIHASSGILILLLSFLLLRLLRMPRYAAFAAVCVIGLNHSLWLISRMAMRDNTALLLEVTALLCLVYGWQRRNYGWSLLGGLVSGLAFYSYYPGRITMFVWLAFVGVSCLVAGRAGLKNFKTTAQLCGIAILGLALVAAPLYIATARHVPTDPYASQQFLWQAAARKQEKAFRGTATTAEAVRINMLHGLGEFNVAYSDQGLIYDHPGYGFTDKITGVLLWLGVVVVLLTAALRRKMSEADRLMLVGFLVIWLSEALLLTRAPDYTRLLIVLPFVGYMIGRAVMGLSDLVVRLCTSRRLVRYLPWVIATIIILVVAVANAVIVRDFQQKVAASGDGVGDTLRFQEKHNTENAQWLFVPGDTVGYYNWGIENYWEFWFMFGPGPAQNIQYETLQQLVDNQAYTVAPGARGYLMTSGTIWHDVGDTFRANRKVLSVTPLDSLGNRVAVTYVDN